MMGSVDAVFGQTITIDPNATGSPVSSHVIGAVRNHTQYQADYYNPNNPTYTAIGNYTAKLDAYSNIVPRFGSQRKLYRLGGSPIDGKGEYEGYFSPTANYGTGSNFPQNVADSYPYDDFHFFVEEAQAMGADMVVGINVGAGSPQNALKFIKEEVLPLNILDQIAYFELGNELYGYWQIGHNMYGCSPEVYRERAAEFIDYFENHLDPAVFMNMKFALMGSYNGAWATYGTTAWITQNGNQFTVHNSPTWTPVNPTFEWSPAPDAGQGQWTATYNNPPADIQVEFRQNGVMVDNLSTTLNCPTSPSSPVGAAAIISSYVDPSSPLMKNGVPKFHFIAYHNYVNNHEFAKDGEFCSGLGNLSDTEKFGQIMATSPYYRDQIIDANNILTNLNVKLAMTEYGTNSSLAHTITEGLHAAENIMDAIRYDMDGAMAFCFLHSWGDFNDNLFFKHGGGNVVRYPVFYVQQLIAENTGSFFLPTVSNGSPQMDVSLCPKDQNGNNIIFNIDVFEQVVTKDNDGTLYLLMLNKDMSNSLPITINGISSDQYFANHIFYHGSSITDAPTAIESNNCIDFGNVTLQPLSVNVLRLTPVNTAFFADITCTTASFKGPEGNPDDYTYLWDFGDGSNSTDLHPVHTYNTSTTQTYTVTLTITSPNGCTKVVSKDIDVIVPPINQDYTYTINADCSVSFTGPTGNPSNTTYSWDFGDGSTSTDQNPSHTYTDNGSYSVVLTVTDACGNEFTTTDNIEVNCNPNFTCPCTGQNAINVDAGNGTLVSTIPELSGTTLINTCLAINGKLIVDKDYRIYFGEIKMQPGAEIIVKNGNQLRLGWVAQSEGIHGCEQMWKGITVEGNARLLLTSSLIKDAQYAVKALDNSNLALANNTFDRNYVGIYTPKLFGNGFEQKINQIYPMYGNTFTCTGNNCHLLPGYQGQNPQPGTLPYAGIEINNAVFSIGRKNAPYSANYFSNMHNGVVGNKSFIVSYYAEMNDMHPFSNQTNGCGFKGRRSFIVSNHSSISSARKGIESLSDYYIQSKNDNISNVTNGVDIEGVWFSPVIEDDKIMDFSYAGIDLSLPKFQISSSIQRNYLQSEISSDISTGMNFVDIPYGKNLSYNQIVDNYVVINSKGRGIWAVSSGKLGIQNNTILIHGDLNNTGILLQDAMYNYIHGNTMTKSGTGLNGSGLELNHSSSNTICNNTTGGWNFGNNFWGGCANTSFKFNQIGENAKGLWINPSSNIGKQIHHGNAWFQAGYRSAYHLEPNGPIRKFSQFQIKTCDAPLWPDYVDPTQGCETSTSNDWFYKKPKEPGIFVTCDPIFNFKNHPSDDEHIRENDISLVNGAFKNTQYGEMLNWEQSRYLYRKMYNQEDLLGVNALTDEFFYENEEAPLGTLVEMEEQVNEAFSLPYDYYPDWEASMDTILSILSELGLVEELLENSTSVQDSLELANQRSSLYTNIKELSIAFRNKAANMDVIKTAIVNELSLKNNAIQPQTEIEQLEKSLNTLYFGMLTGKEEWSSQEQVIIRDIANRCPMQFGHIVLKARGLVTLFDDQAIYFDDERLCTEVQSRSYRVSSPLAKVANFEIQPNPAYDLLQVSWKKEPPRGEKVHFEIRSLDGFVMKSWFLDKDANGNHLDISNIQPGFYIARINIGNTIETQKIIILR